MVGQRQGGPTLVRAIAVGAALWGGLTHTITHRLVAPVVAEPVASQRYGGGPLGPLVLATLGGLLVLSSLAIAGAALRGRSGRFEQSLPATAAAPAVFTALETLTHLDAHHGGPRPSAWC